MFLDNPEKDKEAWKKKEKRIRRNLIIITIAVIVLIIILFWFRTYIWALFLNVTTIVGFLADSLAIVLFVKRD